MDGFPPKLLAKPRTSTRIGGVARRGRTGAHRDFKIDYADLRDRTGQQRSVGGIFRAGLTLDSPLDRRDPKAARPARAERFTALVTPRMATNRIPPRRALIGCLSEGPGSRFHNDPEARIAAQNIAQGRQDFA